ncbi:GTP cyclohydrolase II RibA [Rhizobium helianthi]|uniref:GTP cyclohydrolase-2 n=1 Tax=Rhizobium helianthi TaxID=1132695 RepID=A0ABW4M4D2_9HYPH
MSIDSPFARLAVNPAIEIERAVSELRYGRPVVLTEGESAIAVSALDALAPDTFDQFAAVSAQQHVLYLTQERAARLGLKTNGPVCVPLTGTGFEQASRLAYALDADRPSRFAKASLLMERSAELAITALLLPAMVCTPIDAKDERFSGCISLDASVLNGGGTARQTFQQVARTPVPLKDHGMAEFVVFRGGLAQKDQVAIIVGQPDFSKPMPIRIHSSCITGDLYGSLKCDCGDQLRNGLDLLAQAGGGILLYLDQEGRGTGIGAKMRAYGFQHRGLDTIDADAELGLSADHRRYEAAVAMLGLLGINNVVVFTNNPTKIAALRKGGIGVQSRTPVLGRVTVENENYLRTKTIRAGHMLELDSLVAAE